MLGIAPFLGTPRNPFHPVRSEGVTRELAPLIGSDADILIGEPLHGVPSTVVQTDCMKLWRVEFGDLIVGRPAQDI